MGDASKNFNFSEFSCPCCGKVRMNMRLIDAIQSLRDELGVALFVNSGFRCPKHNAEIPGSAKHSLHMDGLAADLRSSATVDDMVRAAERTGAFSGIGAYPDRHFIHVEILGRPGVRWVETTMHKIVFLPAKKQ